MLNYVKENSIESNTKIQTKISEKLGFKIKSAKYLLFTENYDYLVMNHDLIPSDLIVDLIKSKKVLFIRKTSNPNGMFSEYATEVKIYNDNIAVKQYASYNDLLEGKLSIWKGASKNNIIYNLVVYDTILESYSIMSPGKVMIKLCSVSDQLDPDGLLKNLDKTLSDDELKAFLYTHADEKIYFKVSELKEVLDKRTLKKIGIR